MKTYSYVQLAEKDVINVCTGEKLGNVCDIEINVKDCTVISLIVPGQGSVWGFGKATEIIIPWCKIECIGEDTILVRLSAEEQNACTLPKRKVKHGLFGG